MISHLAKARLAYNTRKKMKILNSSDYEDGVNLCFVYSNNVMCEKAYLNLHGFNDSRSNKNKVWTSLRKDFLGMFLKQ